MARKVYDPEVLLQEDFAPVLARELRKLDRQLAMDETNLNKRAGAMEVLSARSGVPCRRIYGYLHGENTFVDLDIADRLLLAFDKYVEFEFEESDFYPESVVRQAALEQTQMMDAWCRHRGWVMPATQTKERRTIPGKIRRTAWAEAQRRAAMLAERNGGAFAIVPVTVEQPAVEPAEDVAVAA